MPAALTTPIAAVAGAIRRRERVRPRRRERERDSKRERIDEKEIERESSLQASMTTVELRRCRRVGSHGCISDSSSLMAELLFPSHHHRHLRTFVYCRRRRRMSRRRSVHPLPPLMEELSTVVVVAAMFKQKGENVKREGDVVSVAAV
ncbi:hypothetical protein PIB30_084505 [Stylosanthes scabra]|uniref:Uncharacterized protein n=1 Tax=Stylosanthes scabra TaxID=79078 RepID=A0ABU6URD7_9FABA|nr:hypothetical protein [Stylosanthes scabra]